MHLNECLQLAVTRSTSDALSYENVVANPTSTSMNGLSFLANNSPAPQLQQAQAGLVQGSVVSVIKCIASDWGTKSQTNFYIPDEYYPGYSYLFYDEDGFEVLAKDIRSAQRPAFVYAEEPNNLHTHHYHHTITNSAHMPNTTSTLEHSSTNFISLAGDSMHNTGHHSIHAPSIFLPRNYDNSIHPMTVPYIHPHLEIPVPPLHLPWYFGALCWSYSLAGALILYLPPKWATRGGGLVVGTSKNYRRHWFPYRAFALSLMICQSPCSFLADYVHMTNVSLWHATDRILACIMLSLELAKLVVLRPYTRPLIYIVYLACCGGAIFCFMKSQKAQETLNEEGFVFWHCGWHCYPIACSVVYLVENFLNWRWGEYYAFECEAKKQLYKS